MIIAHMIALLVAAPSAAAPATSASTCPVATEAEVRAEFVRWTAAYEARDLAGTMAIFAPDVRFQFQGVPDFGRDQLEASYRAEFAQREGGRWTPAWEGFLVSGDLAAAFSTWTNATVDAEGHGEAVMINRSVDVLRRGADCRWRIVRSLTYPRLRPAGSAPSP